jgi:NADPH:quinone reductase-like Zn-dependent oxidoreductase
VVIVSAASVNCPDVLTSAHRLQTGLIPGRDFDGVIVEGADADVNMDARGSGAGLAIARDGAHA